MNPYPTLSGAVEPVQTRRVYDAPQVVSRSSRFGIRRRVAGVLRGAAALLLAAAEHADRLPVRDGLAHGDR
jgi:hypothetical protein